MKVNQKIINAVLNRNILIEYLQSEEEAGLNVNFPFSRDCFPQLIWQLQFALIFSFYKYAEYEGSKTLLKEFFYASQECTRYEVRIGDYVKAPRELKVLKQYLRHGFSLFTRFKDKRFPLCDITSALFEFKMTGLKISQDMVEAEGFHIDIWNRWQKKFDALSTCVVVSLLGERSRYLSNSCLDERIEVIGDIIYKFALLISDIIDDDE